MHPAILASGRGERWLGLNPASGPHHLVVAVEEMQAGRIEDETDGLADGHVGGVADDAHGQRADLVGGDIGIGIRPQALYYLDLTRQVPLPRREKRDFLRPGAGLDDASGHGGERDGASTV